MDTGLTEALRAIGSAAQLARALNITRGAISQWEKVPAERVIEVERVTGVSRTVLRPDLYEGLSPAPAVAS